MDIALRYLQESLEITRRVVGNEHPITASSLNNLGTLYCDKGDYDRALPLLQQSLEIRERVLGEEHPDTGAQSH